MGPDCFANRWSMARIGQTTARLSSPIPRSLRLANNRGCRPITAAPVVVSVYCAAVPGRALPHLLPAESRSPLYTSNAFREAYTTSLAYSIFLHHQPRDPATIK